MANFQEKVNDLVGFGTTDNDALVDFLNDGVKEIISMMPSEMKQKCSKVSILNADNGTTLDLDGRGPILQVTRKEASDKKQVPCREIQPMHSDLANDSSSLHYASVTDPIYYQTSNSSGASTIFVLPTPTNAQPSNVYYVAYPLFDTSGSGDNVDIDDASDTSIPNFPDEAEHLVVLYAAIKVAERLLAIEEDVELYSPVITTLRQSYATGLQALGLVQTQPQQGAR